MNASPASEIDFSRLYALPVAAQQIHPVPISFKFTVRDANLSTEVVANDSKTFDSEIEPSPRHLEVWVRALLQSCLSARSALIVDVESDLGEGMNLRPFRHKNLAELGSFDSAICRLVMAFPDVEWCFASPSSKQDAMPGPQMFDSRGLRSRIFESIRESQSDQAHKAAATGDFSPQQRLFIIEDETDYRIYLSYIAYTKGYQVASVSSNEEWKNLKEALEIPSARPGSKPVFRKAFHLAVRDKVLFFRDGTPENDEAERQRSDDKKQKDENDARKARGEPVNPGTATLEDLQVYRQRFVKKVLDDMAASQIVISSDPDENSTESQGQLALSKPIGGIFDFRNEVCSPKGRGNAEDTPLSESSRAWRAWRSPRMRGVYARARALVFRQVDVLK